MKLRSLIIIPSLFLFAACGDDSTAKPDFSINDDLSMPDDQGVEDLSAADHTAPPPDLSPLTPSGMIQQARNMADSSSTPDGGMISLPIMDVYVTSLRPLITAGADPAGFFVQADAMGPALLIAVDPATLSPPPMVGDLVRFNVTSVQKINGTRQAGSVDTWSIVSSGNSTTALVQDLTAATDLVTGLESYESELIKITSATVASSFASSAAGYVSASITTAGITTVNSKLKLRIPTTMRDMLDVGNGCVVALGATPLERYFDTSEPSAWASADFTVTSCPAPRVLSASVPDDHTVIVTFDRNIASGSLVTASGNQFGFTSASGAITPVSATLSAPNQVTVTTTTQTASVVYTVTVAATLTDTRTLGIDAAHNSANFTGYVAPAGVLLNEVNAGITGNRDLIELKVTTTGSLASFTIYQDVSAGTRKLLATLPALVVTAGDFVIVHLNPAAGVTTETNVVGGQSACTDATCVGTAWDIAGSTTNDIANSARIVTVNRPDGNIVDAMAFSTGATDPAAFPTEMKAIEAANFWLPAMCPNACAAADADSIAVPTGGTAAGTQTTVVGRSAQRTTTNVPGQVSDWTVKASTWGIAN